MMTSTPHQELCRGFAALFSYPDGAVRQTAEACATQLGALGSAAAAPMARFTAFLDAQVPSRLEELFTATFDLQPLCHPYVGYLLCGESQQRTLFLIRLQQLYRRHGFNAGSELPDHLATLLRFAGTVADRQCGLEIVRDGLLPALDMLIPGLEGEDHPYTDLVSAVQCFLTETVAAAAAPIAAGGGRS